MRSLSEGDLTIEVVAEDGAPLRCNWSGKSGERQPGKVLGPFFDDLLAEADGRDGGIEMHFEQLDHFNSSTITVLIRLIQSARSAGVPLVMVYDKDLKWQRLSFDALRVFEKADDMFKLRAVSS